MIASRNGQGRFPEEKYENNVGILFRHGAARKLYASAVPVESFP